MTLEELSKETGVSESYIKGHFKQFQESFQKKRGLAITKSGRGKNTEYFITKPEEVRALTFYEEANANRELFVDDETIQLEELTFRAFLGLLVRPELTYRGTYKDYLAYIGIKYTDTRRKTLEAAFHQLAKMGYLYGGPDSTDPEWFLIGLSRRCEKKIGVGVAKIKKCKELAEANNKQSYVPLLKTWIAKDFLSDSTGDIVTRQQVADFTGLSLYQITESTKILVANNLIKEEIVYEITEGTEIVDGVEITRSIARRTGCRTLSNGIYKEYYEPINEEEMKEIRLSIAKPFGAD